VLKADTGVMENTHFVAIFYDKIDPVFVPLLMECSLGCGTFLDILTSRIIFVIRKICHADQE